MEVDVRVLHPERRLELGKVVLVLAATDDLALLRDRESAEAEQQVGLDVRRHDRLGADLGEVIELALPPDDVGVHRLVRVAPDGLRVEDLVERLGSADRSFLVQRASDLF